MWLLMKVNFDILEKTFHNEPVCSKLCSFKMWISSSDLEKCNEKSNDKKSSQQWNNAMKNDQQG